jgi:hypothetical protein
MFLISCACNSLHHLYVFSRHTAKYLYLFTITLAFLRHCPYLITIRLAFLPYFPYHFTIFFYIFQIVSLFNLGFFHNFHIFSLFNLLFFCIFYMLIFLTHTLNHNAHLCHYKIIFLIMLSYFNT